MVCRLSWILLLCVLSILEEFQSQSVTSVGDWTDMFGMLNIALPVGDTQAPVCLVGSQQ